MTQPRIKNRFPSPNLEDARIPAAGVLGRMSKRARPPIVGEPLATPRYLVRSKKPSNTSVEIPPVSEASNYWATSNVRQTAMLML